MAAFVRASLDAEAFLFAGEKTIESLREGLEAAGFSTELGVGDSDDALTGVLAVAAGSVDRALFLKLVARFGW